MGFLNQNLLRFFTKSSVKKGLFLGGAILLSTLQLYGQKVTVIDAFTQQPLEQVMVVSQDKQRFTTSDLDGKLNLDTFTATDLLTFQLMGYETVKLSLKKITDQANVVALFLDEKQLAEIVLSVARTAEQSKKIAEKVAVINQKTIARQSPTTGADLLLLAPSVRLQKSQGGGGSPVLRGFEANRVLLVVDGVRLNNAIYRAGHLQNAITVDPNSIERVEVIFGSSSVGYGSDALGGVVHYYTKTPRINNSKTLSSGFSSTYNSAQNAFINHFETEASFNQWASYTSLTYSSFGDLRMGKNRQHGYNDWGLVPAYSRNNSDYYYPQPTINPNPNLQKNTGYTQFDFLEKAVINLPKAAQLTLNFQLSNSSNIPRFDKLNEYRDGELRFAEWSYGPQKRFLFSPQLKLFPKRKWLYKGTITAAFQAIKESRIQRRFGNITRETQLEDVSVFSLNGDFETAKKENISFAYGFEWVFNQINSNAFSNELRLQGNEVIGLEMNQPIPTRYPSDGSRYNIAALYGNYRFDLSPKTTLAIGGRFTATELKANWKREATITNNLQQIQNQNNALTASLGLSYRPANPWRLNLLFSSGFRAPNVDDLGKIRENRGLLLVPNPGLKPEYVYNIDAGIAYTSNNKKLHLNTRFYHSSLRNYIGRMNYNVAIEDIPEGVSEVVLDLSSQVDHTQVENIEEAEEAQMGERMFMGEKVIPQANSNIGNAAIFGAAFEGLWNLHERFSLGGNLTYTQAALNKNIGPLPSILPLIGGWSMQYHTAALQLALTNRFNGAKAPADYSIGGEDRLDETPIKAIEGDEPVFAGTPKWAIYSLSANYTINEQIRLNAAVDNIFDLHYRTFASGISAPGRSLILGTSIRF